MNVVDEDTPDARSDQHPRMKCGGHKPLRPSRRFLGQRLHRERAPLRLRHGRADALKQSKRNQLADILRKTAEQRAYGGHHESYAEKRVAAIKIADPAED